MKKQFLIVVVPVANLRKEPVGASEKYLCDNLQETQLLYNECLLYKDENEDWYCVEAAEQKRAAPLGIWKGYSGWIWKKSAEFIDEWPVFNAVIKIPQAIILKDPPEKGRPLLSLSIGTRLFVEDGEGNDYYKTILADGQKGWIKKDDVNIPSSVMDMGRLKKNITETARLFLGMPYLWGGRSAYIPPVAGFKAQESSTYKPRTLPPSSEGRHSEHRTVSGVVRGVDCSSLTNLAYRVNWLDIPRDAHDQWIASAKIPYHVISPADLIFVSAEGVHDKVTHVMIYLSGEEFVEALETGSVVFINSFKNKFGVTLQEAAKQGCIVNKRKIYFGSILITGKEK